MTFWSVQFDVLQKSPEFFNPQFKLVLMKQIDFEVLWRQGPVSSHFCIHNIALNVINICWINEHMKFPRIFRLERIWKPVRLIRLQSLHLWLPLGCFSVDSVKEVMLYRQLHGNVMNPCRILTARNMPSFKHISFFLKEQEPLSSYECAIRIL